MSIPEFQSPSEAELKKFAIDNIAGKAKRYAWLIEELQKAEEAEARGENPEFVPREDLMAEFYRDMAKIYEEAALSKEEIEQQFSAENLSQLSLEEYIKLLRKVPPRFILHVTRQGIRDRISFHSGTGELYRGFENIIQQNEIKSTLEHYLEGLVTRSSVKNLLTGYLHMPNAYSTRLEAEKRIRDFLHPSNPVTHNTSEMADISAVHAAMDFSADEWYGGERENEYFFVYPTAHVASQYKLTYQMNIPEGFKGEHFNTASQYNDLWITAKEKGAGKMPLDAAIAFIPENSQIDPETGSRYEVKDGHAVPNSEQLDKLMAWIKSESFQSIWRDLDRLKYNLQEAIGQVSSLETRLKSEKYPDRADEEKLVKAHTALEQAKILFQPFINSASEAGITDARFFSIFETADSQKWDGLRVFIDIANQPTQNEIDKLRLDGAIVGMQMQYRLADKTVSAKKYWEDYFTKIGKRPSKVIYYEQATPNEALVEFRKRAGLKDSQHSQVDLAKMFEENIIFQRAAHDRLAQERELIVQYVGEILDEWYK